LISVEIYDLLGNNLGLEGVGYRYLRPGRNNIELDSQTLGAGIYFIRIADDRGGVTTLQVVK
jgi:hypothetical protein